MLCRDEVALALVQHQQDVAAVDWLIHQQGVQPQDRILFMWVLTILLVVVDNVMPSMKLYLQTAQLPHRSAAAENREQMSVASGLQLRTIF